MFRSLIKNNPVLQIMAGILSVASLHWVTMQLYIYTCVHSGLYGFFASFITLGSPVCQFMNYLQFELAKNYITVWAGTAVSLIAWVIAKLA